MDKNAIGIVISLLVLATIVSTTGVMGIHRDTSKQAVSPNYEFQDSDENDDLLFDLTPLKILWRQYYHGYHGTIIIWLEEFEESITYTF